MGTRIDPDSWGESPRRLWEKRRKTGRCVEVVVVAWEQKLLDRAGRRLQSWAVGEMSEVEKEALMLRQAMAEADWDTVESHGRFNGIIEGRSSNGSRKTRCPRAADRSRISASGGQGRGVV